MAIGADSRHGIGMIRSSIREPVEMVDFEVGALLGLKGSGLPAAFADSGSAFQGVLPNCLCPILDGYGSLPCVR
jgi:hypothetical protein